MLSANSIPFENWAFDVSALMILISEDDEKQYRLARRSLVEAFAAAPVSGIQNYLRSYDLLLNHSQLNYFSPYGCKSAPLRNMKLDNLMTQKGFLKDHKFTVMKIRPSPSNASRTAKAHLWYWVAFTWLFLAAALTGSLLSGKSTATGLVNCTGLVGWSIVIRVIEYFKVQSASVSTRFISQSDRPDAAFFLGRSSSCLALEGNREDVKRWTSCGLVYSRHGPLAKVFWQWITRGGTFLVLAVIFSTIPNGSTVDQLLFIAINILAQANTLIGRWLNANCAFQHFDCPPSAQQHAATRTHVYAEILRRFRHIKDRSWVNKATFLPQTPVWAEWRGCMLDGYEGDAKELYDHLLADKGS